MRETKFLNLEGVFMTLSCLKQDIKAYIKKKERFDEFNLTTLKLKTDIKYHKWNDMTVATERRLL